MTTSLLKRSAAFSCRKASSLLSKAMDRPLSIMEKISLDLHLMMCRSCAAISRQLHFLEEAARRYREKEIFGPSGVQLPDEAKERIRRASPEL